MIFEADLERFDADLLEFCDRNSASGRYGDIIELGLDQLEAGATYQLL